MNRYDRLTRPRHWRDVAFCLAVGLLAGGVLATIVIALGVLLR